jgi:hypothetical protein
MNWRDKRMNTLKEPNKIADRNVVSILETVDVQTGERTVLAKFDYLIEAPNWTRDGKYLIYNSQGYITSTLPYAKARLLIRDMPHNATTTMCCLPTIHTSR